METRKKTILSIVIFSIAFLIAVNIWPIASIQNHDISKAQGIAASYNDFTSENRMITHVIFQEPHLENMVCYLDAKKYPEVTSVTFRMLDENFKVVYEKNVRCETIDRDDKVKLNINLDVEPGKNYFYEWIVPETVVLSIPLGYTDTLAQPENQAIYIDEVGTTTLNFMTDYDYTKDFTLLQKIVIAIFLIVAASLLYNGIIFLSKKVKLTDKDIFLIKKIVSGIIVGLGLIAFIYSCLFDIWDGNIDDKIVYAIGIITLTGWILLAIWSKKKSDTLQNISSIDIWRNYIQIVCIALALYSACRFVNAESEITHVINTRRLVTYLLIAFAMIPDIKNRPDYKIWKNWNLLGTALFGIFLIAMMINKSEYTWPPVILLFLIPLIFRMTKEGQRRLINNFSWGVYVSFFITTGYCLIHRPYNKWIFYRYPGMFHTVAYTGMYLSIVVGVSFARYIAKKRKFDLFMFATSVGYVLLSMTRTAMLSIAAAAFVTLIIILATQRDSLIDILKQIVIMAGVIIASFCMVFSATRMVPALVNDPIYMNIEGTEAFGVCKGEKIDSPRYLRFNRYVAIMFGRFGSTTTSEEAKLDYEPLYNEKTDASDLVASLNINYIPATAVDVSEVEEANLKGDLSNGRFTIFEAYIKNISWEKHEVFSCVDGDKEYAHAHNAYLQVAYLFGLFAGIVFALHCVYTFIMSINYSLKHKKDINVFVPLMIVAIFGVTSAIEWTYQPAIPLGFVFMYMVMFLNKRAVEDKANK